jgi:transcriptional regulator with XRE-family HTH domain
MASGHGFLDAVSVKKSPFLVAFGKNLQTARRRAGMSQEDLAHHASLHQVTVSLIENGRRAITLTTLERLARALRVQPSDLVPTLRDH